ncbi:winged helix-turn-helix transcriptional regulator [Enterococcus sp. LJL99]
MKKDCLGIQIFKTLGGKWKLPIIWIVSKNEGIRYNELRRQLQGITNTSLTRALKSLEANQLIIRKNFETIPPHVEYYLADKTQDIVPALDVLAKWGAENIFEL